MYERHFLEPNLGTLSAAGDIWYKHDYIWVLIQKPRKLIWRVELLETRTKIQKGQLQFQRLMFHRSRRCMPAWLSVDRTRDENMIP